ncbi:poly(A) RNA polymerase GLD2 [Solea solea]|uniref:poly(A) RNA polymerase GLD2 n=1 Tax=Solea solea TaxID=90069 RepID=UPI00272D67CE|nr:poly(A) RNA polymerase GLD2 [Solea solea]
MFHRSATPRDRTSYTQGSYTHGSHTQGPYTPSAPVARFYPHNYQNMAAVSSFKGPIRERLPQYEWQPPVLPPPLPPPNAVTMTNRRKRPNEEYSPHVVKRQRLSPPRPRTPPPLPRYRDEVVARPSRSTFDGYDRPHASVHSHPRPEAITVPQRPDCMMIYAKDKLSAQMVELFERCQQQISDLTKKESCRSRLLQDIRRIYTAARLYLTGSSMNGLGCRSSDADLCLVIQAKKRADTIHTLSALQRLFNSLSYIDRTQLIRAKVPILKFREKNSDLEFDLNINNTVGIRNTFLLRSYAYADLRIRPLILVIKKWAQHMLINDASRGTLSSYTLVLMVLHFLQTLKEPVIPSLQRDHPECFNPFMEIDMIPDGPKHIPPYISKNQSSLGELLLGFLKYYARDFRWDQQVISIREARAFPKNNSKEWRNKFICVEEPFERNNVARAVHERIKFDAIKTRFAEACQILHKSKDLNSIIPVRAIINKESSGR